MNLSDRQRYTILGGAALAAVVIIAIIVVSSGAGKVWTSPADEQTAAAETIGPQSDGGDGGPGRETTTGPGQPGASAGSDSIPEPPGRPDGSSPGGSVPTPGSPSPGIAPIGPTPGTPPPPGAAPEVISRGMAPQTSKQGDSLIASAMVGGVAERVVIVNTRSDGYVFEVELLNSQTANGYTIWLRVGPVAAALAGEYSYTAKAYTSSGAMVEMTGGEGYTFRIDP